MNYNDVHASRLAGAPLGPYTLRLALTQRVVSEGSIDRKRAWPAAASNGLVERERERYGESGDRGVEGRGEISPLDTRRSWRANAE